MRNNPLGSWLALLWALAFLLFGALPARADDVAELLARLEARGARIVKVDPLDVRLREGRLTVGVGADGKVEVYLPHGAGGVRTPLKTPTERMSIGEFRELAEDMRRAVRTTYGIEVERVMIAGSSSGLPFHAPDGEVRTFDRKGPGTSDFDGALISAELFAKVEAERPGAVRGRNTGLRTAPDPLPELRGKYHEVSEAWGRHVAAMIYANEAEFKKRMELTGLNVGVNVMVEPGPGARYVEVTRAEVIGAIVEAETITRLASGSTIEAAKALVEKARGGDAQALAQVNKARKATALALAESLPVNAVDKATLKNEALRLEGTQGFAGERVVAPAPLQPWKGSEGALRDLFREVRTGTHARARARLSTLPSSVSATERAKLAARLRNVPDARLEVVNSNNLLVDYVPERNSVRVSTGVLNLVESKLAGTSGAERALRSKVLGLLFAHELSHAGGLVGERMADAEAIKVVEKSRLVEVEGRAYPLEAKDVRATVDLFRRGSNGGLRGVLAAIKDLPRYGTPGARTKSMLRTLRGEADPLARYRRADGTLDWKRVTRESALKNSAGVAHFALALFLKELAVVVRTGDRLRIEEFFDGVATTDFFVTYGLFSVGAQAGNVAYSRFLARYVKPRFVSNVLRTNVVLATGLLLPELVHGELNGKAFAIDLGSLGLSATAVQAGVASIRWVVDLRKAESAGRLARAGVNLKRLARVGGWFYTAAETAVVLYLGDEISRAVNATLDEKAARNAVRDATIAVRDATIDASVDEVVLRERLATLALAHQDWRNHLLRDVAEAEALYALRVEKIAAKAKVLADERSAATQRFRAYPALLERLEARHGSLQAWVEASQREDQAKVEKDLGAAMTALERARAEGLAEAYASTRRDDPLFVDLDLRSGRFWDRMRFTREARDVSENRLEAYEDEVALLQAARAAVRGRAAKSTALDEALVFTRKLAAADRALTLGRGAAGALEELEKR